MPIIEIGILFLIFFSALALIRTNFKVSLFVLLVLSVFLHKEFFSIYRWDVLPVRMFMLAFTASAGLDFILWLKSKPTNIWTQIKNYLLDPFVLTFSLFWFVSGLSLIFSENIVESILAYGSFTTIFVLGVTLYQRLRTESAITEKLIRFYLWVMFALCLFGFTQLFVYLNTGFIFGALWNVPTKLPRIGTTFWDVNHFGALLAATIPVFCVFVLTADSWKKRITYVLAILPMVAILLLTNSRSAWILAFISFVVFLVLQLVRRIGFKGIYIILAVLMTIGAIGLWEYSDKESRFRAEVKDYFHYRIDSFDSHMLLLQGAYQVLELYPYLGGGYGSFYEQFSKTEIAPVYFGRDPISITSGLRAPGHSIWGETAAETGWIGLFVFVLLTSTIIFSLLYISLTEKNFKKSLVFSAMVSSLIGWLTAGIFYSYKAEFFWIIFFLYFIFGISTYSRQFSYKDVLIYFAQSSKFPYLVILAIAGILIFWNLGANRLIPWDEAIYAKIAKNMATSNDFITMRWDPVKVWYEKPPLSIWLMAISIKLLGVSELAARLPTALLGLFTVLLTFRLGKRLFSKTAGFIAAIALVTTTNFLYYSRTSMLDVSVTFFILASLYFYWKAQNPDNKEKSEKVVTLSWILVGVFAGLGFMVKNVVGLLPFVIIGLNEIYLLVTKQTKFKFTKYLLAGFSTLLIALPWHLEMYRRFGEDFIDNYIFYHIIERGTSAIEDKGEPFFWYITVMKVSMRIWFVALLAALPVTLFYALKKSSKHVFLTISFFVIFLFFSSAQSKLVWYITPIYPIATLIVGHLADFIIERFKLIKRMPMKFLAIYCVTMFALFYLFLVKNLVYTSDLTGPMANLLVKKEETLGKEIPVLVDQVPLPVIMFYLDGPYRTVEYSQLEQTLKNQDYDQPIAYITKESRQERIQKQFPTAQLITQEDDFAFGFEESQYARDKRALDSLKSSIDSLIELIEKTQNSGGVVPANTIIELNNYKTSYAQLQNKIEMELAKN